MARLNFRRGSTFTTPSVSEPFFNTDNNTLLIGTGSTDGQHITLVKLGENTGSVEFTGDITGSNLRLSGDITARDIDVRDIRLSGDIFLGDGNQSTDNIYVNASFSGSLLPDTDNVYTIGNENFRYKEIHSLSASFENVTLNTTRILSSSLGDYQDFDSFSGSVDNSLDNLNLYTQSNDQRVSSIEIFTQSAELRLTDLEFFSSSEYQSDSSSFDSRISSLTDKTGSYATTGSNTFIGNQAITGSVDVSGSVGADSFTLGNDSGTTTIPSLNDAFNIDFSGSQSPYVNESLVLGDGKILIAGRFESVGGHITDSIARLNSDGTVDTSFTSPSLTGSIFTPTFKYINTFTIQSDDKIIIVGNFSEIDGNSYSCVARLNTNGTLDNTFANPELTAAFDVRDVVIQNDGKIVIVGDFNSSPNNGIIRLNDDGTIDTTLDVNGTNGFADDSLYSIALQTYNSTDYLLVGGNFNNWEGSNTFKGIARIEQVDGDLDFFFGGSYINFTSNDVLIRKIKVDSNNDIYIAGQFEGSTSQHKNIARLSTSNNGTFVSSFATFLSGGTNDGQVRDFEIFDNKILIGGDFTSSGITSANTYSADRFVIVNESNGAPVSGFTRNDYSFNDSVRAVSSLSGDNLLAGGDFGSVNSITRENLASLKIEGSSTISASPGYIFTTDDEKLIISSSNTFFTGDVNISGSVTASVFSGSFVGDGSELSGVTAADVEFTNILNKPTLVSGSDQVTQSLDLRYLEIDGDNVFSGSSQVDADTIVNFDSNVKDKMNLDGVISGSAQITDGSGILSSSNENFTQFSSSVDSRLDAQESFSESLDSEFLNTNGDNVVSGSDQLTASLDLRYLEIDGDNVVSGSDQLTPSLDTRYEPIASSINTLISSSLFTSDRQGTITASINGNETLIDLGLKETNTPIFSNVSLTSVGAFGNSEITALFLSSSSEVGTRSLGSTAFFNTSSVVADDPNSIPTNKAVNDSLVLAGLGDITAINDSELYTEDYLGLEHTGDGTLNGGYGQSGDVVIAIATGSLRFTQGVVKALPSGVVSGSDQLTSSLDNQYVTLEGDQTIGGTKTFNDIVVNGTGSFAYITSVTGEAKIIGDAYIVLNNDTPTERYAGIKVYDSGSNDTTASLEYDGQSNDWFYQYTDDGVTDEFGTVLFGPEYSSKGIPNYPTNNTLQKGDGGHHLLDSNITDTGTLITLGSNTQVNGTLTVTDNISAPNLLNLISGSSQITDLTTYTEDVSGNSTYTITHNLNEEYPLIQAWNTSSKRQEVPSIIESTSVNSLEITFAGTFAGKIIVKK